MIGVRDVVLHQRSLRLVLANFWPRTPEFRHSNDLPLDFLVGQKLRLARTGSEPVTASFWKVNRSFDPSGRGPQRLRAAVFHGRSLLCVADGVGVVRHCVRVASREGVHCYVAKWTIDGLDLSVSFWR